LSPAFRPVDLGVLKAGVLNRVGIQITTCI
jgi:hypothetical protein